MKKIIIIGAGPGGLTAAMLLAHKGYEVEVFEKGKVVGGRCSPIKVDGYTFDVGPTFVMMPELFDEIFQMAGRRREEYVPWKKLDMLYTLNFGSNKMNVFDDKGKLKEEIARLYPGDEIGYQRYLDGEKTKYERMYPCLKLPYMKLTDYLSWKLLRALPHMDLGKSLYDVNLKYFKHEEMRLAMTFQSKYLGMSPWTCPGAFSILSYIEHTGGVFHPDGGVHKITEGLARAAQEDGAKIHLDSPVEKAVFTDGMLTGVQVGGVVHSADVVIMNADFAYGMKNLFPEEVRPKTTDKKIDSYDYSCSTFMIYLGIKGTLDLTHHSIHFAKDYRKNIEQIFDGVLPDEISFYIHNASVTDPSLAPEGKSAIYVLAPVPNLKNSKIDWEIEKQAFRDRVIARIKEVSGAEDLEDRIEVERIISPATWQSDNIYGAAVFNLSHTLGQLLYFRPHNKFEEIPGLYLVGGGTHPGSGLPTIIESARITVDLISKDLGKE